MRLIKDMLAAVETVLLSVSDNVGHFFPIDGTKTHIVYAEDTEASSQSGDNHKLAQAVQGTIDLYARPDDVGMADQIQAALDKSRISFSLNSVLFEDDQKTQYIHYEWLFEVT